MGAEKVSLIQKEKYMDIQIQSICWFVLGVILFIVALVDDKELKERKACTAGMIAGLVAVCYLLYLAIMWIVKMWVIWCL